MGDQTRATSLAPASNAWRELPAARAAVTGIAAVLLGTAWPAAAMSYSLFNFNRLRPAQEFLELRREIFGHINERADDGRFPVIPQRLVHDVRKVMPEDGIVCLDNGMYKIWFARN